MAVQTVQTKARLATPHTFTLEEYERLVEAGGFDEDARIELIRGEILDMTPIGFVHELCVARLTRLLTRLADEEILVWPQNNSIRLRGNSRPQPDLTLLKSRDFRRDNPPAAEDVILVIEVAESSLRYDRTVKGPLYGEAGIPEYWIVNLKEGVIEVYTEPAEGAYRSVRHAKRGEMLALPGGIRGGIEVGEIVGVPDEGEQAEE